MSFKAISYLELWQPLCLAEQNPLCNFGRGHIEEEQFYEIILNMDQWFRRRCRLKIFLNQFCLADLNRLCNLIGGYHGKHFCDIILNLDQWFRRCRLKIFLI